MLLRNGYCWTRFLTDRLPRKPAGHSSHKGSQEYINSLHQRKKGDINYSHTRRGPYVSAGSFCPVFTIVTHSILPCNKRRKFSQCIFFCVLHCQYASMQLVLFLLSYTFIVNIQCLNNDRFSILCELKFAYFSSLYFVIFMM